jgi:hypothetical protein
MCRFRFSRTIFIVLCFVLIILSCTLDETHSTKENVSIKAVSVPEGISLCFDSIPANTTRVYVEYYDWGGKDVPESYYDGTCNYAFIKETSVIERLKDTHTLTLPFVQTDHKYKIGVVFFLTKEGETQTEDNKPIILETECIAYNGIYCDQNIGLSINETQTIVKLSSRPQFSSEVQFAPTETSYKLTLLYSGTGAKFATISIGDEITKSILLDDGLTWNFEPEMADYLKEGSQIKSGVNYPAYFTARSNVIYDDITWSVEIAKSREFSYSIEWVDARAYHVGKYRSCKADS